MAMNNYRVCSVRDALPLLAVAGGEPLVFLQNHWLDCNRNHLLITDHDSFRIWDCRFKTCVWEYKVCDSTRDSVELCLGAIIDSQRECVTLVLKVYKEDSFGEFYLCHLCGRVGVNMNVCVDQWLRQVDRDGNVLCDSKIFQARGERVKIYLMENQYNIVYVDQLGKKFKGKKFDCDSLQLVGNLSKADCTRLNAMRAINVYRLNL